MRNICLTLLLFTFSSMACAQSTPNVVTPETMTRVQPFTTYDGVKENISLINNNPHKGEILDDPIYKP